MLKALICFSNARTKNKIFLKKKWEDVKYLRLNFEVLSFKDNDGRSKIGV